MKRHLTGGLPVSIAITLSVLAVVSAQPPRAPGPPHAYYLVQFEGPILEPWKAELLASGAEILEYVPDFAFKVRLQRRDLNRVAQLPGVVSVTDFSPRRKLGRGVVRGGSRGYLVVFERGTDLPLAEAAIAATGAQVVRRDGSRVFVIADAARLDAIADIPDVASIENFLLYQKHNEFGGGLVGANPAHAAGFDGSTQTIAIADTGLGDGTAAGAHGDLPPSRIASIFNWPGGPATCFLSVVDDGAADVDTGHGTHVATTALGGGQPDGVGRGTAPGARLIFQAVENWAQVSWFCTLLLGLTDGYYLVGIPSDIGELFGQAHDAGARVHSNSWGSEAAGAYTAASADADAFVWTRRDMTITMSAGNSGIDGNSDGLVDGGSITSPATAKNVITVGASENDRHSQWDCDAGLAYTDCAALGGQNALFTYSAGFPGRFGANPLRDDPSAGNAGQMAAFSSRGPAADGRIKPDVVAPGTWMLSGYSGHFRQQYDPAPNPRNGRYQYDGWGHPRNPAYKYMGGTSMSAPLVAGAAAVVRDFYEKTSGHQASAALVKATLITSAVDLLDENNDGVDDNAFPIPNIHEGWGRIDLANATSGSRQFFDEQVNLSTGDRVAFGFPVSTGGAPLKITLVWTDYPSTASAVRALVNDLDLKVTGPDGVYAGNAFAGGWSVAGGAPDRINNVENVYVAQPAAGEWTVTVSGFNVPMGPQPFALVIDGASGPAVPQPPGPALPLVTVTAPGATAAEAGSLSGAFRIARAGDTSEDLQVSYAVSGTASPGSDYAPLPGQVLIPAGSSDATLLVQPIDDDEFEPDETVVLTLNADARYDVGDPASASVTIVSDDQPSDLIVAAVQAPSTGSAGGHVTVADTTRNQGAGTAEPSETGFYLSTNTVLDAADVFLGSRPVSRLTAGASEAGSVELQIPGTTTAGSYRVIAKADWNGSVAEAIETNNVRASASIRVGPDLVVTTVTAPSLAAVGGAVTVADTTSNPGAGDSPASITAFYLAASTSLKATDPWLGERPVPELEAGAAHASETTLVVPGDTPAGSYYIIAKADAASSVAEANEGNNTRATSIKVGPDLTVPSVVAPATGGAGRPVSVTETVRNAGLDPAGATTARWYLSANANLDASDVLLGSRAVPPLAGGSSSSASASVVIPEATATGVYYILVQVDPDNAVAEFSETNNIWRTTIRIGPDLTVPSLSAPSSAVAGTSITITDRTSNPGGGDAAASVTSFYLSANLTWDSSDILLGSRLVPALDAGTAHTGSTTLSLPLALESRTYYIIAVADAPGEIPETFETNNRRVISIRISLP